MTTAAEFASLLTEHRTAYEALKATEGDLEREKYDQEGARYRQACAAVLEAVRPSRRRSRCNCAGSSRRSGPKPIPSRC
jgi:hypothetical protein